MTTRLARTLEAPCSARSANANGVVWAVQCAQPRRLCVLKSAIKLGFREVPQEPIATERDRLALRKLRARSKTLIAGPLHGVRVRSLHDQIPIAGARLSGGFSRRIREQGIGLKQVRGVAPIKTDAQIESRQDASSQPAWARSQRANAVECGQ